VRKETNDRTRQRIGEDLEASTAKYADYAENRISKLQQAYLKKYHPQEFRSTEVLQRPEDSRNKRSGSKVSALFGGRREGFRRPELTKPAPAKPEEGIANITHGLQVSLLS
jgi:hypothetical protein